MSLPKPLRSLFSFVLVFSILHNSSFMIPKTYASFSFGDDGSGGMVVKDSSGNVKMKIDSSGFFTSPMKFPPTGDNLIINGGFEAATDGTNPDNWVKNFNATCTNCTYAKDTTYFYDGSQSYKLTSASGNSGDISIASNAFPVQPGRTYQASIGLFTNGAAVSNVSITIVYFTGSVTYENTTIANKSDADYSLYSNASLTNSAFTIYPTNGGDFTPSPTACGSNACTKARLVVKFNSASAQNIWVDNIRVTSYSTNPLNATYVSAGAFGANAGGGNYSFPSNVGIGTTGPAYKLDVQAGQVNASGGLCIAGDCKTAWSQVTGTSYWTASGNNIYNNNSGNVGVGTTGPAYKLDVAGTFGVLNSAGGVEIQGYGENAMNIYSNHDIYFRADSDNSGTGNFHFINSENVEVVTFLDSGNVGIGTTGPAEKLDLNGNLIFSSVATTKFKFKPTGTASELGMYDSNDSYATPILIFDLGS